jgi:aspartyl-tRNA(Asn)/glutamyl-tRNA(Gln) amidotransferase subunit A
MGAKVEQTDPGFQNPLEIFNIHRYADANALRAHGEKLREMMEPGLIEIANEGAEYSALEYLEAVGRRSELAIHMGRFHAEWGLRRLQYML